MPAVSEWSPKIASWQAALEKMTGSVDDVAKLATMVKDLHLLTDALRPAMTKPVVDAVRSRLLEMGAAS